MTVPYILSQGHGEQIMTNDLKQGGGTANGVEECGLYSGFGGGEDVCTCVCMCEGGEVCAWVLVG